MRMLATYHPVSLDWECNVRMLATYHPVSLGWEFNVGRCWSAVIPIFQAGNLMLRCWFRLGV